MKRRSLAARSNRALAHLKNGDALQAKLDCEAVLKEDGGHVKCKFRRAQALVQLGSIEQACDVFKALMEVPSLQREARAGLLGARKMLRAHRDAERELFRGKIKAVPVKQVEKPPRKNALERTVVASLSSRRAAGRAAGRPGKGPHLRPRIRLSKISRHLAARRWPTTRAWRRVRRW